MNLLTINQADLIVNSVKRVLATGDIEKLTKAAYNFLMLSPGFIAHYNHSGFKDEYRNICDLQRNIINSQSINQWNNFRTGERDYDYMMQKKAIFNRICNIIFAFKKDKSFAFDPISAKWPILKV